MPGLGSLPPDGSDALSGRCQECERAPSVGPCAACEALICGDCGVFSRDPAGVRVICASCARMVADVASRRVERRPPGTKLVALLALAAFLAFALSLL